MLSSANSVREDKSAAEKTDDHHNATFQPKKLEDIDIEDIELPIKPKSEIFVTFQFLFYLFSLLCVVLEEILFFFNTIYGEDSKIDFFFFFLKGAPDF